MSGFAFRPKIKDADYYWDAILDVVNKEVGDANAALLELLETEETAATLLGETREAHLFRSIRMHLIYQKP